jgi:hypothetical protein
MFHLFWTWNLQIAFKWTYATNKLVYDGVLDT